MVSLSDPPCERSDGAASGKGKSAHTVLSSGSGADCAMAAAVEPREAQSVISGHVSWSAVHPWWVPSKGSRCCQSPVVLRAPLHPALPTGRCPEGPSVSRVPQLLVAWLLCRLHVPRLCRMVQGGSGCPRGGLSVLGGQMWHALHSFPRLGIGIPEP